MKLDHCFCCLVLCLLIISYPLQYLRRAVLKLQLSMKNLLHTLSLCALTFFAAESKANTFYVSPSGSDSNPGTIDKPFKTWQKLSSVLKAGDTGYIRGGTYTSPLSPAQVIGL